MNFLKLFEKNNLVAAHRGANSTQPENTMSALVASLNHCDFIEVDVQLSSDEVCIIMHDNTLKRTTNISDIKEFDNLKPYKVSDFTLKELEELDYGSWFYKDLVSKYEPLLTLDKALKFIKKNQIFLNIEIKDISDSFNNDIFISKILTEIKNHDVENLILLSSFRDEYLLKCKNIAPNIATALLIENKHPKNLIQYLKILKVDAYNISNELVDKELIKELKDAGFYVNVYTINNKSRAKELYDMGVNGVFTDFL